MGKFKNGDRVRLLAEDGYGTSMIGGVRIEKGSVFSLSGYDEVHYYLKTDRGSNVYFDEEDLELVSEESSESEKSDNISVTTIIKLMVKDHKYILTKAEAKELSDKLIKELS